MTQQQECTVEQVSSIPLHGRSYALARLFSQIFHPMITITISFFTTGFYAHPQWLHGIGWALLSIFLVVMPIMIFYIIRLRQGVYSDYEVSIRQQRHELYLFTLITLIVSIALLFLLNAPSPLIALIVSGAVLNMMSGLINVFWKISVHSATAALSASVAMIYVPTLGVMLWFGALLVGWSRIVTHNHNLLQVLAGLCLATMIVGGVFRIFGLI